MKVSKKSVINLMVCCLPLCPYKFISIGDKDISMIFIIWGLLIMVGLFSPRMVMKGAKENPIVLVMISYFLINSMILSNHNIGSIIQFVLLWAILLFSYRVNTCDEYNKTINLFMKIMNIMAVYGIYEFIGRIFHLPLSDPWIPGLMVEGYNWYNMISIGSIQIARINGIFVEPSMYSQFLAINILLYLFAYKGRNSIKTRWIVINAISLILSFSGTGILLLAIVSMIMFFTRTGLQAILQYVKKNIVLFGIGIVSIVGLMSSPVGSYLVSRLTEFDPTNTSSISGYIRFVGQFNIAREILKTTPFLGIGIGNAQSFIDIYRYTGGAKAFASLACSMIAARYAAELGIIGLIILLLQYKSFFKKERISNTRYKVLLISVLVMIPLCDSGINVTYWFLLYLINLDFKGNGKEIVSG